MALDFRQIRKPVRKLRKLLKKMPALPSPEQVHDFRTNARRFEAILHAFAMDSSGIGRRTLKPLAKLRKRAGKVRDMDVLTAYAASVHPKNDEKECAVQLLEHLGAKREKKARELHSSLKKNGNLSRKRLKRTQNKFKKIERRRRSNGTGLESSNVPAAALEAAAELSDPARLDHSNLHPFRLKVKALRNILQLADSPDRQLMDLLGSTKDAIGEWHDWEELVAIAEKTLDHRSRCGLVRELKSIARQKYHTALQKAQELRRKELGSPGRKNGRSQRSTPATPVLSAALTLAA